MTDYMEYSYPNEWVESLTENMKAWLSSTWTTLDGEAPEPDFVEYIMVMIKTQKKMNEVKMELMDLGVEEEKAREFVVAVGKHLEELASTEKPRTPKVASKVVSTISDNSEQPKSVGPLKSSRGGDQPSRTTSGTDNQTGSSRLLQSALQSSRDGGPAAQSRSNRNGGAQQDNRDAGLKRGSSDNNNSGNKRSRDQGRGGDDSRGNRRSVMLNRPPQSGSNAAANSAPAHGTVEYFEQMNKVAQASGFRNAQEMIASQKEMMAMMGQMQQTTTGMPAAPMMQSPALMHGGFPAAAADGNFQPPYPGGPPPQQWGQGRGGRGYGRGAWTGGRGRGGRGPPPPADSTAAVMETGDAPAAIEADAEGQVPTSVGDKGEAGYAGGYQGRGYQGRGYQGRGRGRGEWASAAPGGGYYPTGGRGGRGYGRGGGGRFYPTSGAPGEAPASTEGAPAPSGAAPHKTWVRQADMNSSLVTGR